MIPVYVLTGFLGAGKTSLLGDVLASGGLRDVGLIVNELGAIGIDGALLGADASRQVELPGGCVCCLLSDELDQVVRDLAQRRDALRALVIETTGIAEPLGIVWTLERLADIVRVAAVITVVDAENWQLHKIHAAAVAQVRDADIVLLNKRELIDEARYANVRADVAQVAPLAAIVAGDRADLARQLTATLMDVDIATIAHGIPPAPQHVHLQAVAITAPAHYDLELLEEALAALPANVVRIKGLVWASDPRRGPNAAAGWFAVHRVGARVSSEPAVLPPTTTGRIVALGDVVEDSLLTVALSESALGPAQRPS